MEASASKIRSQQTTPQNRVFKALSPEDAVHLISKSLERYKLETTDHDIRRLIKHLVRASKALEACGLIEYNTTTPANTPINLKSRSNQTFIQSLIYESGKFMSKAK